MKAIFYLDIKSRYHSPVVGEFINIPVKGHGDLHVYQSRAFELSEFNDVAAKVLNLKNLPYRVQIKLIDAIAEEVVESEPKVEEKPKTGRRRRGKKDELDLTDTDEDTIEDDF